MFSQIWPSTGTPAFATFVSGLAAAIAALFIRLEILVEMMSIGKFTEFETKERSEVFSGDLIPKIASIQNQVYE